ILLVITTAITAPFVFVKEARRWAWRHRWIMFIGMGIIIFIHFIMCCCKNCFTSSPCKWILFVLYMLAHSIVVAVLATIYAPILILMAFGICAILVLALTLFAIIAPCDFTSCWVFLFLLGIAMMLIGIVCIFVYMPILHLIFASLGILLYSLYLVVDIQMIVGGKHRRHQFEEDEYVLAALSIYHDIIFLFLYILQLLGLLDD
ncbi:hypothetical protein KR026_011591, partial [Drosophila bipectinata]